MISTQTAMDLEQVRDELALCKAVINGELLSGYLPEGAAVECTMTNTSLCFARRAVTAPVESAEPMLALERLIERLNRCQEEMRWELRRREKPSAVEIWLVSVSDLADVGNDAKTVRDVNARLGGAAQREGQLIQAVCQPGVTVVLNRFLSGIAVSASNG